LSESPKANLELLRRTLQRMVEEDEEHPPSRGIEKRRHKRHYYTVEAKLKYVKRFDRMSDSSDEFTVVTKDLSRSGISFIHEHEMYLGEIIQVEVEVKKAKRMLLVKVTRCRRAGLKVFDIAGEFVGPDEAKTAGVKT